MLVFSQQASSGESTTQEKIQKMEKALQAGEQLNFLEEEWDEILEEARNSNNRDLELRARTVIAAMRNAQRLKPLENPEGFLDSAWNREVERHNKRTAEGVFGLGSAVSLGIFALGATFAGGSMVLGDQFWKEFVTSPAGSTQAEEAYGRMVIADYVSVYGAGAAILGAFGFVVFELLKE